MSGQSNIFAEFTSLVEKAAFVTVDTELSGLTEDRNNITSLDEYLLLLRDGVTTYSMRGYRRLECEASTSGRSKRQKKVNRYGLQRYLEVIKKHNKPLVVHNGLLDLLHLYDKFIGVIPELPGDICNALYTKLGPGIYDTKYVSRTLQSLGIQETLKYVYGLLNIYV
uniref:Uncharacterized protein n=1 Tax=Babesia bovis TaxID=5865 RepID=A7ATM5_BABBO|eukprot:XP_001609854.1 hypothetical protein [Babesia bovis T2Bo]